MSYISTNNISIFPVSKERPQKRENNIFYESNIANIARQLIDTEGFIVTPRDTDSLLKVQNNKIELNKPLVFNIYGYYVELGVGAVLCENATAGNTLYACIEIKDNEINGQDVEGKYEGLQILTSIDELGEDCHCLPLIKINSITSNSCEYELVEDSYTKIHTKSFDFSVDFIDGQR